MGGIVHRAGAGLPAWGPEMDWNVQCDTHAAQVVFDRHARPHARDVADHVQGAPPRRRTWTPLRSSAGRSAHCWRSRPQAHAADNGMGRARPRVRRAPRRPLELPVRRGRVRGRRRAGRARRSRSSRAPANPRARRAAVRSRRARRDDACRRRHRRRRLHRALVRARSSGSAAARQLNCGMTCLPIRSMVCITCSWPILYGFTRQSSRSTPAAS